jgi:glutamate racemase
MKTVKMKFEGGTEVDRIWISEKAGKDFAAARKKGEISAFFGVIAGTPVDTQMGVDNLTARGCGAVGLAASATPHDQGHMQVLAPGELTEQVLTLIHELSDLGADGIWIYCNSMSTAVDLPYLRENSRIPVITPLDVYKELALDYKMLGVIAANNQSLAGIERTLQTSNPHCWPIGASLMPVVLEIEAAVSPEIIIRKNKLAGILTAMQAMGGEALLLGCTHFPYMKKELAELEILPIIDPADRMAEMLNAKKCGE